MGASSPMQVETNVAAVKNTAFTQNEISEIDNLIQL